MYTDSPVQWALANFEHPAERQECATQFLIAQAKKVRQEMKSEAKKAAEPARAATAAAVAKRAKHRTVAAAPVTPAPATPRTRRAPRNPMAPPAPATPRTSRTPRSHLANRPAPVSRSTLPSSSPLANRGHRLPGRGQHLLLMMMMMMMMMMMGRFLGAHQDDLQSGRDRWSCPSCGSTPSAFPSAVLTVTESTLRPTLASTSSPALFFGPAKELHNFAQYPCCSRRLLPYKIMSTWISFPTWNRVEGWN